MKRRKEKKSKTLICVNGDDMKERLSAFSHDVGRSTRKKNHGVATKGFLVSTELVPAPSGSGGGRYVAR